MDEIKKLRTNDVAAEIKIEFCISDKSILK
jgi:hypothetical protein